MATEKTVTITFTEGEAVALVQLIHLAVQARGLDVADAGVFLRKKITEAAQGAGWGNGNGVFQTLPQAIDRETKPAKEARRN